MELIFREINRIKEVKRVTVELENWAQINGAWQRMERSKPDNSRFNADNPSTYEM